MASAAVYLFVLSLLPLGLSHRPYQVALHYPHFPPLASIIPHFSPLFYWTNYRAVAKPHKDIAKPVKDMAKPSLGKKDALERELNASYLRHERSQHVTGRQAAGDLAQWHHTVFKI